MALEAELSSAKREVNTDTLSLSVNELVTMYEEDEVNIHPAFQRTFRWGPEQQSNLIESILIGIPLPPVFFYERLNGEWELIDGLQRVSSILKFMGKLREPGTMNLELPSFLRSTKYLPSLENAVWDQSFIDSFADEDKSSFFELPGAFKLYIKRSRINVQVLKQPSTESTKFDLFQRLNRGGTRLNSQEVRTCIVVMRSPDLATSLSKLAEDNRFREMCRLDEEDIKAQVDVEYITRLICHTYVEYQNKDDLNEFLDRAIFEASSHVSVQEIERTVSRTLDLVYGACGKDALVSPTAYRSVFTLQGLESVLVGVARNLQSIEKKSDPVAFVRARIQEFWNESSGRITTTAGMRASSRITKSVPLGETFFSP
jgi:hypothetical protein